MNLPPLRLTEPVLFCILGEEYFDATGPDNEVRCDFAEVDFRIDGACAVFSTPPDGADCP